MRVSVKASMKSFHSCSAWRYTGSIGVWDEMSAYFEGQKAVTVQVEPEMQPVMSGRSGSPGRNEHTIRGRYI